MSDSLPADQAQLIREAFPDLIEGQARFMGAGWDHDAWLFNDEILVRVPRHPVDPEYFSREASFLALLGSRIGDSASTPIVTHLSDDATLLGHRALRGSALTEDKLATLGKDQFAQLADSVGAMLNALHAIAPEDTAHLDPIVRRGIDHVDWLQSGIDQHLRGAIPDAECDAFERFLPELGDTIDSAPLQVVLHGDFGLDAIVIDETDQEVGFIDFSDWAIGDPAMDFGGLTWTTPELADAVLDRYAHRSAAGDVLSRATVYNKMIAGGLMIHARIGADVSLADTRADFRRRFGLGP